MQQSLKETFDVVVSLAGTARIATANGTGVDLQPYNAGTIVVVPVSWTDGTHALTVQESDDNSTFTNVAAGQLDGTMPTLSGAGGVSTISRVGYLGTKRYIRVVSTVSGATTGAVYAAMVLRGSPRRMPK